MVIKRGLVTKALLPAVLFFALCACSIGMDGVLGRTTDDPFAEIPKVRSFNGDSSIVISWLRDEAADMYYLYRAADALNPNYQVIYSGHFTEYVDVFDITQDEKPYLYRLGKQRGQKHFVDLNTPGRAGLGIVSGSIRDVFEPNNTRENSTYLSNIVLEANSWFYGSNSVDRISIYDEDWYCVDIPPQWAATIILVDLDPFWGSNKNHFLIEKWRIGSQEIITNTPTDIINTSNYPGRFYFRIYPNYDTFQSLYPDLWGTGSGGCGKFIRYTIRVSQLTPR